jgi:hypothetical protein
MNTQKITGERQTREAGRIAVRLMGAALAMGLAVSAHAAKAPAAAVKAKASTKPATSDWRMSSGFVVPGITGSIQTRVGMLKNRFPVYAGADLDLLFMGGWGYSYLGLAPMASVTVLFPLKAMVTPTAGASMGPSFALGGSRYFGYGGAGIGFAVFLRPGMLVNIDKGVDVDIQFRMGVMGGLFEVMPQAGVRFEI